MARMTPEEKVAKIREIVRSGDEPIESAFRDLFQWIPHGGRYPLGAVSDAATGCGSGLGSPVLRLSSME